jgi:O-antigen ligase
MSSAGAGMSTSTEPADPSAGGPVPLAVPPVPSNPPAPRGVPASASLPLPVIPGVTTRDATSVLSLFVLLLLCLPARFVFGPLGAAGAPAVLVGQVALVWWITHRVARAVGRRALRQPVRVALLLFLAAVMISYVAAMMRPIDAEEVRAADRGLLMVMSWLGVCLLTMDGVTSRQRLDTLARRVAVAAGAVGLLAICQYVTRQSLVDRISIPGLTANSDAAVLALRDGVLRPAGTAVHPIELGVVLTMALPLAVYYAMRGLDRPLWRRSLPLFLIACATPLSVSRSAVLCSAASALILIPALPRRMRSRAYLLLLGFGALVYVAVPGMITTMLNLFLGAANDSSALSRTNSYSIAFDFIGRAPVVGRGFGTFLPKYRILDNQYLGTLIEMGVIGLVATLALFVTGIVVARGVRRLTDDGDAAFLGQALAASMAAGALSFAFFDAFAFPMVPGLMFLFLGAAAALRRLVLETPRPPSGPADPGGHRSG